MKKFFVLALMFFTSLFADETVNEITKEGPSYNYWAEFVNMLLTLGFVLILIILSVWVLKKIMRSRIHILNRSNGIKILERRPLNQKSSLYLVDILGKGVVIAESPAGIHKICEFSDEVNVEELFEQLQEEQKPLPSFKEKLSKLTSKRIHA